MRFFTNNLNFSIRDKELELELSQLLDKVKKQTEKIAQHHNARNTITSGIFVEDLVEYLLIEFKDLALTELKRDIEFICHNKENELQIYDINTLTERHKIILSKFQNKVSEWVLKRWCIGFDRKFINEIKRNLESKFSDISNLIYGKIDIENQKIQDSKQNRKKFVLKCFIHLLILISISISIALLINIFLSVNFQILLLGLFSISLVLWIFTINRWGTQNKRIEVWVIFKIIHQLRIILYTIFGLLSAFLMSLASNAVWDLIKEVLNIGL